MSCAAAEKPVVVLQTKFVPADLWLTNSETCSLFVLAQLQQTLFGTMSTRLKRLTFSFKGV